MNQAMRRFFIKIFVLLFSAGAGVVITTVVKTPFIWLAYERANDGPIFPAPLVPIGFIAFPYGVLLFPNTHPKMEALEIELWRSASPTRKMQMLAQLNLSARMLALTGLHSQYPQSSETELRRRLAGLLLGEEIACKVYGKLPK